jgi:2Fe-2S ferredoxin
MKVRVTDSSGATHELEGLEGWRLMEVIRDWGVGIKAECGGSCTCATCHVYVGEEWADRLPEPTEDEEDLLFSTMDKRATSRLSCQLLLSDALDGLAVEIAPSAAAAAEAAE